MFITQSNYASTVGVCIETVGRRLKGVPHHSGAHGTYHYHLAAILPTVRPRELPALPLLVASAACHQTDSLYVGDALPTATRLIEWLPAGNRARLVNVQNQFVVGVANSNICAAPIVENLEALRTLIILQPDVLRYVLDAGDLPDMDRLSPAFALVNNTVFNMELAA